ncbi:2-hydroxychromene-2-carboxylate isomerase [Thalassotalea euphylliae]|uniref:2-hydroxychromene-2-carboxylate isomerase n=1 Tax=Thalassotalea euphylliae TaxID=1655234 RepID=A0A3E0UK04_9GAMM|nr:2-hydroxychromene-2-carboxylate isomerase [Thalassotalea euphylliae]REL37271.1 2-hydroxychromene-2-carboxylate isomerase [Thalassotalea euphylliae]
MTTNVEFHFDFGSPNAYLAHLLVQELTQKKAVNFDYVPVLLGGIFKTTGNTSPFLANQKIKNKFAYMQAELRRFLTRYQLADKFKLNPHFPVNTLMIMRGAIAAQSLGEQVFEKYVNTMFDGMWRQGLKMDDAQVLIEVLSAADLPADEIMTLCQSDEIKQKLAANTQYSVDKGSFGAPSFYIGDELFFGKETVAEIAERLS